MGVFFAEDSVFVRNHPVDAEVGVVPSNGAFGLWGVVVVALVLEDGFVAQYGKAMGKATRHEELAVVVLGEQAGDVLPERGTSVTNVNSDVEHAATDDTDEFGLCERRFLKVEASDNASCRARLVVLHEGGAADFFLKFTL